MRIIIGFLLDPGDDVVVGLTSSFREEPLEYVADTPSVVISPIQAIEVNAIIP